MRVIQQRLPKQAIHVYNEANLSGAEYPSVLNAALSEEGATRAAGEICAWPNHARTPLVALPALAQAVGLSELYYKDEGGRFGVFAAAVSTTKGPSTSTNGARLVEAAGYCNWQDPREESWYVSAVSGPKDVVIVLDMSASMSQCAGF